MCTTLHNESAWFDAFKTYQMLYKQKIYNTCRTHATVKVLCCYSQQNGVSHTPTVPPLSLFLCVTNFSSRFSPWCCSSTWPWRAQEIALQALELSTLAIPKPLAIPASAEITELTASLWSGGSKFRGKEEEEEESHPCAPVTCQWTRLIHTFFPNAHCSMFRGQWRIQVEQEASWLWVRVRGEFAVLRLLSCPSTQILTLTISRNLPLSLGGHNRPECAQIKAAWLHENWARLPPNYFLLRLSAPRGGCREQMQKSCPDSTLTKITDPLLEPEMPINRVPQPRPKRCCTNTLLSMLLVSDLLSIGEEWVCLFFSNWKRLN